MYSKSSFGSVPFSKYFLCRKLIRAIALIGRPDEGELVENSWIRMAVSVYLLVPVLVGLDN